MKKFTLELPADCDHVQFGDIPFLLAKARHPYKSEPSTEEKDKFIRLVNKCWCLIPPDWISGSLPIDLSDSELAEWVRIKFPDKAVLGKGKNDIFRIFYGSLIRAKLLNCVSNESISVVANTVTDSSLCEDGQGEFNNDDFVSYLDLEKFVRDFKIPLNIILKAPVKGGREKLNSAQLEKNNREDQFTKFCELACERLGPTKWKFENLPIVKSDLIEILKIYNKDAATAFEDLWDNRKKWCKNLTGCIGVKSGRKSQVEIAEKKDLMEILKEIAKKVTI